MNNINYIDKIVKDSIGGMKVAPESSWQQIQQKMNNTPHAHVSAGKNFFSSIFSKIVASFAIVAGIVSAVFFIGKDKNAQIETQKPVDVTIEIVVSRQADVTIETVYDEQEPVDIQNNSLVQTDDNSDQTNTDQTSSIVIINVETTEIDTIRGN